MRERRQNETAEETQGRRDANSSRDRARRGRETKEETQGRRDANSSRDRARRGRETKEEKQERCDANARRERTRRAQETREEMQERRNANAGRGIARRGLETNEEMQERRDANANRQRNRRIRVQVQWKEAALNYDPSSEYTDPSVEIGQMSDVCTKCQAKKWPGEPPGMCCSSGKVSATSTSVESIGWGSSTV